MHEALRILIKALAWALALPLLGYSIFACLTIIPLLGVFLGPKLLELIYQAGFVPSLATALAWQFIFLRWNRGAGWLATCAVGVMSAAVWYRVMGVDSIFTANYVNLALAVATVAACSVMPLTKGRTLRWVAADRK